MSDHRQVSLGRKVAYGFGSVAFGVKSNGFDYFFLIFYSQVMGVSAYLVSLALMVALIVDALSDPLIGYLSDNTRSRWGRRHPFMYAAALPAPPPIPHLRLLNALHLSASTWNLRLS